MSEFVGGERSGRRRDDGGGANVDLGQRFLRIDRGGKGESEGGARGCCVRRLGAAGVRLNLRSRSNGAARSKATR
jgi:hypothetical protein